MKALVAALVLAMAACSRPQAKTRESDLPFYSTSDFTAEWVEPSARESTPIHRIADFAFTDQDGQAVTRRSLEGKIYVADFFFTYCPGICPKMRASFKLIQDAFDGDSDIRLVSHTVDPESDTRERLSSYAKEHGVRSGQWHLVTGDREAIYALARTSYFAEKTQGLSKSKNEFLHTENMLLIDKRGRIRGVYNATLPAEALRVIEDIKRLKGDAL